jgi:peptidoglycan/LPS O-acetylase OafA/YrhL
MDGARQERMSKRLPALTGIRGIAALAVFLCHFQPLALEYVGIDPASALRFIGNGFRGVDLFFVLSGFILFHVHTRDFATIARSDVRRFYVLRFFRVYPLNAFVLILLLPLPFLVPQFVEWHRLSHLSQGAYHVGDFSGLAFVQSFFLAQTWTIIKPGTWNEPAWTLSAEVFGYACFPAIAVFANRVRTPWMAAWLASASVGAFIVAMVVGGHATNNPSGAFGLVRMLTCFSAGVCLCRFYHLRAIGAVSARRLTYVSVAVIAISFAVSRIGVVSVAGFAGLILGLAYQVGPVNAFLAGRFSMWLGKISFSFYLVHLMCIELLFWVWQRHLQALGAVVQVAWFLVMIAAPLIVGTFTYWLVEEPFQRLGRRVARRVAASGVARQTSSA